MLVHSDRESSLSLLCLESVLKPWKYKGNFVIQFSMGCIQETAVQADDLKKKSFMKPK